jgi:hypothetical protein
MSIAFKPPNTLYVGQDSYEPGADNFALLAGDLTGATSATQTPIPLGSPFPMGVYGVIYEEETDSLFITAWYSDSGSAVLGMCIASIRRRGTSIRCSRIPQPFLPQRS